MRGSRFKGECDYVKLTKYNWPEKIVSICGSIFLGGLLEVWLTHHIMLDQVRTSTKFKQFQAPSISLALSFHNVKIIHLTEPCNIAATYEIGKWKYKFKLEHHQTNEIWYCVLIKAIYGAAWHLKKVTSMVRSHWFWGKATRVWATSHPLTGSLRPDTD